MRLADFLIIIETAVLFDFNHLLHQDRYNLKCHHKKRAALSLLCL